MLIYLFPLIASALAAFWDIPWHQTVIICGLLFPCPWWVGYKKGYGKGATAVMGYLLNRVQGEREEEDEPEEKGERN